MKKDRIEKITVLLLLMTLLLLLQFSNIFSKEPLSETLNRYSFSELLAPERELTKPVEGEKICYLTFDDGPSKNTVKILDILKEYDAKATFFVIGNSVHEENKEILDRIVQEGHAIGLHANDHVYQKFYADENSFLKDYECLYTTLKEEYGIETSMYRLPGGSACKYLKGNGKAYVDKMRNRGFYCFDWNVTGEDSVGTPTIDSIRENVFDRVFQYEKPIVLLHDSVIADKTVEALPEILSKIRENGYSFQTLENREEYVFPCSR